LRDDELDELEPPPPPPPELEDDPPPPPPELELEDDPPPLDDELEDEPPPLDDDELDDELDAADELDELDEAVLELEPWPAVEDAVPLPEEDPLEVGSVTPVPHALASIPTPASAAPPERTRRNCRRSSRRASPSAANPLDSFIPLSPFTLAKGGKASGVPARGVAAHRLRSTARSRG
jgi:hypothetical protein